MVISRPGGEARVPSCGWRQTVGWRRALPATWASPFRSSQMAAGCPQREGGGPPREKPQPFCHLLSEVTPSSLSGSALSRESVRPAHIRGVGVGYTCEGQGPSQRLPADGKACWSWGSCLSCYVVCGAVSDVLLQLQELHRGGRVRQLQGKADCLVSKRHSINS